MLGGFWSLMLPGMRSAVWMKWSRIFLNCHDIFDFLKHYDMTMFCQFVNWGDIFTFAWLMISTLRDIHISDKVEICWCLFSFSPHICEFCFILQLAAFCMFAVWSVSKVCRDRAADTTRWQSTQWTGVGSEWLQGRRTGNFSFTLLMPNGYW